MMTKRTLPRLTKYEQETILNYNEAENTASVYTHNVALMNKLRGLMEEYPEVKLIRQAHDMLEVEVPKKWIRVSPPRRISEETKAANSKRLDEYRKNQNKNRNDKEKAK